jgi:G3E family GTPase
MNRLPVTLVGGFLGAGKTSLLHHMISEHRGGYLAVLVENPGPLNLDAKALRGLCGAMRRTNDAVYEIPAGDEAAQVGAIARTLRNLAEAGRFERVLIEVAGTSGAAWLADHFGPGGICAEWGELQQVICVIDALEGFCTGHGPESMRASLRFQYEQIGTASLVVLNKCDQLHESELADVRNEIRRLYPRARVVETAFGEVPAGVWAEPAMTPEIFTAITERVPSPEAELPPLSSALYRVYRPFHPQRFWDWFQADHPGLLRVKGLVWLATRNLLVGGISRTRWQNSCGAAGIWWAALPREEWPQEPGALILMQETWREPYGDRRQELVLIGDAELLTGAVRRELDACLLSDEELARPVKEWGMLADPFPAWDLEEG